MSEVGTGLILQVIIDAERGTAMQDLNFSLDFYVERDNALHIDKADLAMIITDEGTNYYARIDTSKLGRGRLMCITTIYDREPLYYDASQPIVLKGFTGRVIGKCGCDCKDDTPTCNCYDEGYRITFVPMADMPVPDAAFIYWGVLKNNIDSYGDITEGMILNTEKGHAFNKLYDATSLVAGKYFDGSSLNGINMGVSGGADYGFVLLHVNAGERFRINTILDGNIPVWVYFGTDKNVIEVRNESVDAEGVHEFFFTAGESGYLGVNSVYWNDERFSVEREEAVDNVITGCFEPVLPKSAISVEPGDRVVLLVLNSLSARAYKDNGLGGKTSFATDIMGANGDLSIAVHGLMYRVYGEFMTVGGDLYVYVD